MSTLMLYHLQRPRRLHQGVAKARRGGGTARPGTDIIAFFEFSAIFNSGQICRHMVSIFSRDLLQHYNTPLHCACKQGQLDAATLLLQAGASANAANEAGNTALHMSCNGRHLPITQLLLAYGADADLNNKVHAAKAVLRLRLHYDTSCHCDCLLCLGVATACCSA